MYGNNTLPGLKQSEPFRRQGTIWLGYTEATWFKIVEVSGLTNEKLPKGTILKQDLSTGQYSPLEASDIIGAVTDLPKERLVIVADDTAVTGTKETVDGEEVLTPSNVLVGIQGHVDKARIYVGETAFTDLTDEQKTKLNTQLEAWNFMLVNVFQG